MNNLAMGSHESNTPWDYYETMGGGMGASRLIDGLTGVQSHMTNTLNTPIESLESHYPVRVLEYAIRSGSGITRELLFLEPAQVTMLTERRSRGPWGLEGGASGLPGQQSLDGKVLPAKFTTQVESGQRLRIETPGGGGFGSK